MAARTFELANVRDELLRSTAELAVRLLTEGLERGEDRRRWMIDVTDQQGEVVLVLTLAEAADGSGLVKLH